MSVTSKDGQMPSGKRGRITSLHMDNDGRLDCIVSASNWTASAVIDHSCPLWEGEGPARKHGLKSSMEVNADSLEQWCWQVLTEIQKSKEKRGPITKWPDGRDATVDDVKGWIAERSATAKQVQAYFGLPWPDAAWLTGEWE